MKSSVWLVGSLSSPFTLRLEKRALVLTCSLVIAAISLMIVSLMIGTVSISLTQLWQTLWGESTAMLQTVLLKWRMPRVVMALLIGASLGMSGAIFQSLLKNPLGSPDVIGFNTGAYTGALITVILLHGSYLEMAFGAMVGGCLTAIVIYSLAWQQGIVRIRLIIVGIAVSALLHGVNIWLMMSSSLESAMTAALWSAGSLSGMTWEKVTPTFLVCVFLIIIGLRMSKAMQFMEMGDELAINLGINVQSTKACLTFLATALAAAATAFTGPIAFIALAAPQIAQRLTKSTSLSPLHSALVGALLLLSADLLAQHAMTDLQLPVGILTVSLGGIYLVSLLIREAKKSSL